MNLDQIPAGAEQAADDAAYCAAYVDAVHLGPSSAVEYLRTMVHEYDDQIRIYVTAAALHRDDRHHVMAADAEQRAARALDKRDAYADALRVLDIAADSAHRIADRAREVL